MAENHQVRQSQFSEDFEDLCSVCDRKKRSTVAKVLCHKCKEHFCSECWEDHEDLDERKWLEDSSETFDDKPRSLDLCTETCAEHDGQILEIYCKSHDAVLCSYCVSSNHRFCTNVVHIPGDIHNILNETALIRVRGKLQKRVTALCKAKEQQQKKLEQFQLKEEGTLSQVKKHRDKLVDIVDEMAEESVKSVKKAYENIYKPLLQDIEEMEREKTNIEDCLQQYEGAKGANDGPQKFVLMKKSQQLMTKGKNLDDGSNIDESTCHFEPNLKIEKHLKKYETMGVVHVREKHRDEESPIREIVTTSCLGGGEKIISYISSACILPNGSILMADMLNKRVKYMDHYTNEVTDQCEVTGHPYAICVIDITQAAVSLEDMNIIQFIGLERMLKVSRKHFKLAHSCKGLAYNREEFFVSDGENMVYVYDTHGQVKQTVSVDDTGQRLFGKLMHLEVSADSERLYTANEDKGVVCVDRNGREIFTFVCSELINSHGICKDGNGGVFVCGTKSNNVLHIGQDGKLRSRVIQAGNGILNPMSVSYDPQRKTLVVTQKSSNTMYLIKIVQERLMPLE